MKTKASNIIGIECLRPRAQKPALLPQASETTPIPFNKWTRRSFVSMFLLGRGIWKIARFHHVNPSDVETVLRERLVQAGAFNDRVA